MIVDYELIKYHQCAPQTMMHNTEPFKKEEALKYLQGMADAVGLLLEEELTLGKAIVKVNKVIAQSTAVQKIADNLTYEIVANLNRAANFQSRDDLTEPTSSRPTDYDLSGTLTLDGDRINLQLFVLSKKEPPQKYVSSVLTRTISMGQSDDSNLRKFYQDGVSAAISFLNEVKYAVAKGISGSLDSAQLNDLLAQAKALMCLNATKNEKCEPNYEEALPLLLVLSNRMDQNPLVFRLLGRAQYNTENFVESAQAYDMARELSKDPEKFRLFWLSTDPVLPKDLDKAHDKAQLSFLSSAASAWYQAKNFEKAAAHYEEGLTLKETYEAHFSVQLSRSYRFLGQRSKALEVLIKVMTKEPKVDGFTFAYSELQDLLKELRPEDNVSEDRKCQAKKLVQLTCP
jgi:tetratricopeptide (TPR) repeat protein